MSQSLIYHLIPQADWQSAQEAGQYWPASAGMEGFIHFSFDHQVRLTQQRYYRQRDDLLLLEVEVGALTSELRIENGFPHLFGPLHLGEVRAVHVRPAYRDLTLALVSPVHPDRTSDTIPDSSANLTSWQEETAHYWVQARSQGVDLLVWPELSFEPWWPTKRLDPQGGWLAQQHGQLSEQRAAWVSRSCQEHQMACVFTHTQVVHQSVGNWAHLIDRQGQPRLSYQKVHLPSEEGFWEQDYYQAGQALPQVEDSLGMPLGLQICSDTFRPWGTLALASANCSVILIPRATETNTVDSWRSQFVSLARSAGVYVVSVNRAPAGTAKLPTGGHNLVVDPKGTVILDSSEPLSIVTLRHGAIVEAKAQYPGYLAWPTKVYQSSWPAPI